VTDAPRRTAGPFPDAPPDDDGPLVPEFPPYDEHLERGVLGSLLAQPDRAHAAAIQDDLSFLEPADFWREQHRLVYLALRRVRGRLGACLIGDLFNAPAALPGADSAALTALVLESLDAGIVKLAALRLADLGLERLALARHRPTTPAQLTALGARIEGRRAEIETARSGRPAGEAPVHLQEA
jgi:hypothetical protein